MCLFLPRSLIGVYGLITGKNEPSGFERVKSAAVNLKFSFSTF